MKRIIAFTLVLASALTMVGCSAVATEGGLLLKEGKIERISVISQPEGYIYSFSGNEAKTIIDYISGLNLSAKFSENPNEHTGMVWVIYLEYEGGDILTIYHCGNMFIRANDGLWYKMNYEEASQLEALLNESKGLGIYSSK